MMMPALLARSRVRSLFLCLLVLGSIASTRTMWASGTTDPLPSWNDGPAKRAIVDLVKTTTDKKSAHFVPVEERIATFDQDGTLWVEHPLYTQGEFALARLRSLAPSHPEWKKDEPFKGKSSSASTARRSTGFPPSR